MIMKTLIRSALVALALVGTVSAVAASPNPSLDARHYFEAQQHDGS
jgi:hypothetical protein